MLRRNDPVTTERKAERKKDIKTKKEILKLNRKHKVCPGQSNRIYIYC